MEKTLNTDIKKNYNPYIRVNDTVTKVMFDVVLALIPAIVVSYFVYGVAPLLVIATSVVSAVVSEFIFSTIFLRKYNSIKDISGIVTGILLALTLAPFTPLYVVAFGASMGVIFGKLVYSGLGKNMFNPAIVGREFMSVFFPAAMSGSAIWYNHEHLKIQEINIFSNFFDSLILKNSGAIGEYSIILLVLGGLYLLIKDRISWHVPVALFGTVFAGLYLTVFMGINANLSLGGVMLGGIYMATDMPTSPSTSKGKIYYGIMMGISVIIYWINGINFEVLSYSILTVNAFAVTISEVFAPKVFGIPINRNEKLKETVFLTLGIVIVSILVAQLHNLGMISYLVYIYIVYTIIKLIISKDIK